MYATTITRHDLINILSIINKYLINSNSTHVAAFQRIFRYVQKTLDYKFKYKLFNKKLNYFNMLDFYDYSDADWIDTKNDRFLINDHIFFIVEKLILWSFKRQNYIIMFNCEFEYYALTEIKKKNRLIAQVVVKIKSNWRCISIHLNEQSERQSFFEKFRILLPH